MRVVQLWLSIKCVCPDMSVQICISYFLGLGTADKRYAQTIRSDDTLMCSALFALQSDHNSADLWDWILEYQKKGPGKLRSGYQCRQSSTTPDSRSMASSGHPALHIFLRKKKVHQKTLSLADSKWPTMRLIVWVTDYEWSILSSQCLTCLSLSFAWLWMCSYES